MCSRRNFIQHTGLVTAAMLIHPHLLSSKTKTSKAVGLQLYTLRNEIGKDVKGVIAKVAAAGYKEVEVFGYNTTDQFWGLTPKAFKELLDIYYLTSPSGHYGQDRFLAKGGTDDDLKTHIEAGLILGHTYITVPSMGGQFRNTADDYKAAAEKFNKAAELCKRSGLQLAYHNHASEFEQTGATTGYDILLRETDPSLVKFELDIYWAVRGGQDPVTMFKQHPHRFAMWHVKDMDRAQPELNTEVGKGSIDYKKIFASAKLSGVKHILVEQENFFIDPFASIGESCKYIKEKLLPFSE